MPVNRIAHLRELCKQQKLDAFLLSTNSNICYITNFSAFLTTEHDGFVLVTPHTVHLLTTPLYSEAVKKYVPDVILHETSHDTWYTELLQDILKQEKLQTVGFEQHDLRYSEYNEFRKAKIHLIPASLRTLRMFKDTEEIEKIQKACQLTDKAFSYLLNHLTQGVSEKEIAWEMEKFIKEKDGDIAFPSIIAFGQNAANIHHMTTNTRLQKNCFILFDFGAMWQLYASDMSRTIFFGTPTTEQKKIHDTVLTAQQKAIDIFKDGKSVNAASVDKAARKVITNANFPDYPHALGHGIGLAVHEAPSLSLYSPDTLESQMVFTIEPGIYLSGVGGVRIEDMFLLEKTGLKQLTKSPKELIVI